MQLFRVMAIEIARATMGFWIPRKPFCSLKTASKPPGWRRLSLHHPKKKPGSKDHSKSPWVMIACSIYFLLYVVCFPEIYLLRYLKDK